MNTQGELKKGLGLAHVFTIASGAMIGSGLFILPGMAHAMAGPGVIWSYLLAGLLGKAVNAIVRTFQKRTAAGLQSGRNFVIPDKSEQATESSDFELITWLIVKEPNQ